MRFAASLIFFSLHLACAVEVAVPSFGVLKDPKDVTVASNATAVFKCTVPCDSYAIATTEWFVAGTPTRLTSGGGLQITVSSNCESASGAVSTLEIDGHVVTEWDGSVFQCSTESILSIRNGNSFEEHTIWFASGMARLTVIGT